MIRPKDMPGQGSTAECDPNLDCALEQIMQPCPTLKDRSRENSICATDH